MTKAEILLNLFGERVVRKAQINIGASRPYTNSRGKTYRKRIDNTGRLRNSLDSDVTVRDEEGRFKKASIEFMMADYGDVVDKGRRPGKGIPQAPLIAWLKNEPVKPRGKDGKFKAQSDANIKSLAYVISRNAKKYGIAPTNFFTEPLEEGTKKLTIDIAEAIAQEYAEDIAERIDTGSENRI